MQLLSSSASCGGFGAKHALALRLRRVVNWSIVLLASNSLLTHVVRPSVYHELVSFNRFGTGCSYENVLDGAKKQPVNN